MVITLSKEIFLADSQKKALSKEAALEIYVPKSLQYSLGKLPAVEDEYEDGKYGMKKAKDYFYEIMDELFSLESDENKARGGGFQELLEHFRWTADRFNLDKTKLDDVKTEDELKDVWLGTFWGAMEPKLRNPALFEFYFDAIADKSVAFWTFLVAAPGGASIETAYGYMLDAVGRYRKVPETDPLQIWRKAVNADCYDHGFGYQVCRDDLTAEIAVELKPKDVAVFGGGWLPEWHFPEIIKQNASLFKDTNFYVCDSDTKVDPQLVMSNLPEEISANMTYEIQDIAGLLGKLSKKGQALDLAILKGVASFMRKEQLIQFLLIALQLLRPGGKLIFDLQLNHFTMTRNAVIFNWGDGSSSAKINLMVEPAARSYAISCLNMAAAKLWKNPAYWNSCNVRIESDVTLDNLEKSDPVGIIVVVEKPHITT